MLKWEPIMSLKPGWSLGDVLSRGKGQNFVSRHQPLPGRAVLGSRQNEEEADPSG